MPDKIPKSNLEVTIAPACRPAETVEFLSARLQASLDTAKQVELMRTQIELDQSLACLSGEPLSRVSKMDRLLALAEAKEKVFAERRQEVMSMSGEQYWAWREQKGFQRNFQVRVYMGIDRPTREGVYKPNVDFLNERQGDSTIEEIVNKAIENKSLELKISPDKFSELKNIVLQIIWHESHGDPLAISRNYSLGIMQLTSGVYQNKINPFNPGEAIPAGVEFILKCYKKYQASELKTKTAYNAGLGAMQSAMNLNSGQPENNFLKHLKKESREYAAKVDQDWNHYLTTKKNRLN